MNYQHIYRKYKISQLLNKNFEHKNFKSFLFIYNYFNKYLDFNNYKHFTNISTVDSIYFGNNEEDIIMKYDLKFNIIYIRSTIINEIHDAYIHVFNNKSRALIISMLFKVHFNIDVAINVYKRDYFSIFERKNRKIVFNKI